MKRNHLRRGVAALALGGVASGLMGLVALPAGATLPPGTLAVTAVGSDTTEGFMEAYLNGKASSTFGGTTNTVQTYNVPAKPTTPELVEGDVNCTNFNPGAGYTGDITYDAVATVAPPKAPNGSSEGRAFVTSQRTANAGSFAGCADIARSSSTPAAGRNEAGMEYVAFAYDAVTWATSSLKAPSTLTRAQVQDIYKCNTTNWNQVGGSDGAIVRYLPQTGSGTRDFFLSSYGITAADLAITSPSCPAVVSTTTTGGTLQENQGTTIRPADIDKAILPYSSGRWSFQATNRINPSIDVRNGVRLGGLTTTAPAANAQSVAWSPSANTYRLDTAGVINETNILIANPAFNPATGYVGVRYVFNMIDTTNALTYGPAAGLVGFDNVAAGEKSSLCSGGALATILTFGFAPLSTAGNPLGSTNLAGASCRIYPGLA